MSGDLQSALLIVAGIVMIVAPGVVAARLQRAHDLKVADRLQRGSDAYFEELRSLETYRPLKRLWGIRLLGLFCAGVGLSTYLQF